MIRSIAAFCILFFSLQVPAQDVSLALQKTPKLDAKQRAEKWAHISSEVIAGFGAGSMRYVLDVPPAGPVKADWAVSGWKNEKVHTQIVIASKKALQQLIVTPGDLKSNNGDIIKKENISVGFVQYVITDEFRNGCGYRKPENFDSSLVADIINTNLSSIAVEKNNTQPVWISIDIPKDIKAGIYTGSVAVNADKAYRLPIRLQVLDRNLPDPSGWKFKLDYWQHPAAIARVHQLALWSDAHFEKMRSYYTMLANAGQKIITASIVDEPWGHQTYDDYPSLIRWTKKTDGSWSFDYSLFDRYIAFVMDCGIKSQINCYSMVPWKIAFEYYDEQLKRDTVFTGAIGTAAYDTFWKTMLVDFTAHLKEKGWFEITTIAMDERPMKAMQSVIALLKSVDRNWKISLAGAWHPEIEKAIDDYCIASKWKFPDTTLNDRQRAGKASTWYVCCTEKYPNMFSFSPPDESVWAGWYTAATGMDGFLRWAYNSWPKAPLKDSRFTAWPAGDTYQVYPGPLSSIRFEKLIEGIQDFEKINILLETYKTNQQTEKLKALRAALATFNIDQLEKKSARQMVEAYKHLLNQ
ncbi:glycoside hydrolase domain-containing protein [Niabella insulamsoli]|uniref:DUF4091 domain-containing protein n=1 Tax=Niabella insulamsoli TaxID=3144874 RepID=UPI0031FC42DD